MYRVITFEKNQPLQVSLTATNQTPHNITYRTEYPVGRILGHSKSPVSCHSDCRGPDLDPYHSPTLALQFISTSFVILEALRERVFFPF